MTRPLRLLLLALLAWMAGGPAWAITCTTITSPGTSINWVAGTAMAMQTYFEVTCNRDVGDKKTSVTYRVEADNGDHANGNVNRAQHSGGSLLEYDPYKDSACGTEFRNGGPRRFEETLTWGAAEYGAKSRQTTFWICITNTTQVAPASGAYTDTITLSVSSGAGSPVGTSPVTIYAPASCTMTSLPAQIDLAYAAFGPQVSSNTAFGVNCTIGMPYTMSLDATSGVAAGLRYTLSLSQSAANGIGAAQNYGVTATIPAGQAGTCAAASCQQTNPHTLTISY